MSDSATTKIEALQLGYLCCAKLKNKRKKNKFKQHLMEFGIDMPANRDQIKSKVTCTIFMNRVMLCLHHSCFNLFQVVSIAAVSSAHMCTNTQQVQHALLTQMTP